jgi:hypothetical protein
MDIGQPFHCFHLTLNKGIREFEQTVRDLVSLHTLQTGLELLFVGFSQLLPLQIHCLLIRV